MEYAKLLVSQGEWNNDDEDWGGDFYLSVTWKFFTKYNVVLFKWIRVVKNYIYTYTFGDEQVLNL